SPNGIIVVLNGFPGTGKLTLLRHLKELLPSDTTCLLHNHLLIDPVAAVIPDRSDEHHELRRLVRAPIFAALRKKARDGYAILMTACLAANNERDNAFFEEHLDLVRGTNIPIIWVNTHCDQPILEQRLRSPGRWNGDKTKLTNVDLLRQILHNHSLIKPDVLDKSLILVSETIDVSGTVEQSVKQLVAIL
ncbi:hypothetical protein B0I35DRAFT_328032, partial [Stachybotrys elegans]